MRAWRVHELGEPSDVLSLGETPVPEPGPGQVRIRVTTGTGAGSACALRSPPRGYRAKGTPVLLRAHSTLCDTERGRMCADGRRPKA